MFSLQKLLGKEDKFYGLLEASAEEARTKTQDKLEVASVEAELAVLAAQLSAIRKLRQKK